MVEVDTSVFGKKKTHVAKAAMVPFFYGLHLGMDVSEEDMYRILLAIEANADELAQVDKAFKQVRRDMPHMQRRGVEAAVDLVPVHPGFAKYMRERGVWDAKWEMTREDAASVETAASLGGQLMPPIMGISAFLMADFLDRSYFDVVARGYAPALVYFLAVALGVYLMSVRQRGLVAAGSVEPMDWQDRTRIGAFLGVVIGLIVLMSVLHLAPMFAALYVFTGVGGALLLMQAVTAFRAHGAAGARTLGSTLLRFFDTFASMTAELTLLLATLSILTSAFVNTGVPPKVGFILVEAASINLMAMVVVAFLFGALLGMGLPPAPTYILTALVIAPQMIKVGVDPWPVHFFAFFLAVWGELTPPTSVVAAVTSKIARASFIGTLLRAIGLCMSLFVLMAAVFLRPEIVLEPGLAQLAATGLVLAATVGLTFSVQARFSANVLLDVAARVVLAGFAVVALAHPDP